jgi:hypothetical protein
MVKQHQTTLRFETYLVGKLANVIWVEDWDGEYFADNLTNMSFGKVIHNMYEQNIEARKIVQHIMHTLVGLPYNWIPPYDCYQR